MATKIARGQSGQADRVGGGFTLREGDEQPRGWEILRGGQGGTGGGGNTAGWNFNPNGWDFSESGQVTVPLNAVLGTYYADYTKDLYVDQYGQYGADQENFQFEVVCMTVRITATETYRDETVYRLSCTATPQGGTPDYTYRWSSDVAGSRAIGAQDQATLEVEIPINSVGTIAVSVTDSGNPPCTASAGFEVCGHVTCEFTTAVISTPPLGETGPYVYECRSSSQSAFGPLEHEWSPDPAWVSEDGTVARFSFPDDDEHSIHLSVEDTTGCRAFKTRRVGGYEFIVSTDPGGEDAGTIRGTRGAMEFEVMVKAEATGNFVGPPPAQVSFELFRPAINGEAIVTGDLVAGSEPPRYEFLWLVRQAKGRWQIKLRSHRSNTVNFKIDKRKQIVEVTNSWVGAQPNEVEEGANCNNLSAVVYNHVGLPLSGFTDSQYGQASSACSGDGCLLFYSANNPTGWNAGHVAVEADGQRVNLNSITNGLPAPVSQESKTAGVQEGVQGYYKAEIRSGSTVNLDED